MMRSVHFFEAIQRHMRVHLGSRNVGVSQNGLDGPEVSTIADHVSGATVAQHVRTRLPVRL
jgi:hypothetical protein